MAVSDQNSEDANRVSRVAGSPDSREDLDRHSARLSAIVDSLDLPILYIDASGVVRLANTAAANLLGEARDELAGRYWDTVIYGIQAGSEESPVISEIGNLISERQDRDRHSCWLDLPERGPTRIWVKAVAAPAPAPAGDLVLTLIPVSAEPWLPNPSLGPGTGSPAEEVEDSAIRIGTLAEMLDTAPCSITVHDFTGRFLYANRRTFEMHGFTESEFLSLTLVQLDTPESRSHITDRMDEIRRKGEARFEVEHYRRDGSVIPLELFVKRVNWSGVPALLSIGSDITERRQAARALAESEERYRAAFETSPDAININRVDGTYVEVNEGFTRLTGYTREEAIGRNSAEMGLWESLDVRDQWRAELHRKGEHTNFEYRFRCKDGSIKVGLLSGRALLWGGEPHYLTITRDLTERVRASEERDRLLGAIEQVREIIVMTDADGRIQYVNPAFEKVTGYRRNDVMGRNPRILKSGKQDRAFYRHMWDTLLGRRTWQGVLVNRHRNGSLFTVECSISPVFDQRGTISGFVAVYSDITDRLRIQDQFLQAQKLESVGRLAGGVAHDFNNMLSIIIGYAEMLEDEMPPGHPSRELADEIIKAGVRARDLTRQLLAFSRKQVLQPEVLDLNEIIRSLEKSLLRLIGEDIQLEVRLARRVAPIQADPVQLQQILMNLAVNARDAMPDGGVLTLGTTEVTVGVDPVATPATLPPGQYVMVTVEDNGTGMTDEVKARIFEPFFTTKEQGKGTGLGLSTVYGIVKQSGGDIGFESSEGKGTVFRIFFRPAETPGSSRIYSVQSIGEGTTPAGRESILFVEDEPGLRAMVERMLREAGYRVWGAGDGVEALDLFQRQGLRPDLVISDMVMPRMGGIELAQKLRELVPDLKLLYVSGYTPDHLLSDSTVLEGGHYLQKPFQVTELLGKVREILDA